MDIASDQRWSREREAHSRYEEHACDADEHRNELLAERKEGGPRGRRGEGGQSSHQSEYGNMTRHEQPYLAHRLLSALALLQQPADPQTVNNESTAIIARVRSA